MERRFFLFLFLFSIFSISWSVRTIAQDESPIDSLKRLGRQYAGEGNFDAAEEAFSAMLEIDSTSIAARNNLGILYRRSGRNNDALKVYTDAVAIVKKNCDSLCP